MIEPISQTILTGFIVGIIIGILDEINRKIFPIIWMLSVIMLIIYISINGIAVYSSGLNWGVGNWMAMLITVNISFFIGKFGFRSFKEVFK